MMPEQTNKAEMDIRQLGTSFNCSVCCQFLLMGCYCLDSGKTYNHSGQIWNSFLHAYTGPRMTNWRHISIIYNLIYWEVSMNKNWFILMSMSVCTMFWDKWCDCNWVSTWFANLYPFVNNFNLYMKDWTIYKPEMPLALIAALLLAIWIIIVLYINCLLAMFNTF